MFLSKSKCLSLKLVSISISFIDPIHYEAFSVSLCFKYLALKCYVFIILELCQINRILKFFFFINATFQYLCSFITSCAALLLISKVMKLIYFFILVYISGWLFPFSLKEYFDIWFVFVVISRILSVFSIGVPHSLLVKS